MQKRFDLIKIKILSPSILRFGQQFYSGNKFFILLYNLSAVANENSERFTDNFSRQTIQKIGKNVRFNQTKMLSPSILRKLWL